MEISNKTLAWFVVAAIAISIIGTTVSLTTLGKKGLTGYYVSNDTGNASIMISSVTTLTFTRATMNFGSGSVNTGAANNCTLIANDSVGGILNKSIGCTSFDDGQGWPLILENAGNTYMNVTLNFSANSSVFPGGNISVRSFQFQMADNEAGSCISGLGYQTWTEVPVLAPTLVCQNLSWNNGADTLKINLKVVVPDNAEGAKSVNILAQGTSL